MCPRLTPTSPLSQSLLVATEAAREAGERAASICATAAETRVRAEHILAESKAARETRRSCRLGR
jgi:hypothetical protein